MLIPICWTKSKCKTIY